MQKPHLIRGSVFKAMDNSKKFIGAKKIERMFANNISFFTAKKDFPKNSFVSKLKIKNIKVVIFFLLKKLYRLHPNILKDILFWSYTHHNSPATKIFARSKYEELRTKLDIIASSLVLKASPSHFLNKLNSAFNSGFYSGYVKNITAFDSLIDGVLDYAPAEHAGARPYFKDGKNKKIEDSLSAYYTFSQKDSEKITMILNDSFADDFDYYLSVLAGYRCSLKDISYSLGIVSGENSNSEMHQDTFSSIVKGFIYLQDIDDENAPFQYLEGSYLDASFRSFQTNQAVLTGDNLNSDSTRIRGEVLEKAMLKFNLKSFTGSKGLLILANTAGYHRKGAHNSTKPRITLSFQIQRKGVVEKFIRNLFSILTFRLSKMFNLNV